MKQKKIVLFVVLLISLFLLCSCGGPEGTYKSAQNLLSQGKYEEAAEKFESLGSYEDAATLTLYCKALARAESGDYQNGIAGLESLGDYKDCAMRITYYTGRYYEDLVNQGYYNYLSQAQQMYDSNPLFLDSAKRSENLISNLYAKAENLLAKNEKGYALLAFQQADSYSDAKKQAEILRKDLMGRVSAGTWHTIGLQADGTAVAVRRNYDGQCDVGSWTDIVAIAAGDCHTVGLKADGTVVAGWVNVFGQCDVDSWTDIVAISAGNWHTVGLKADGTAVAVGENDDGQCDVDSWKLW